MKREDYWEYEKEIQSLIAENEVELNRIDAQRLADIKDGGGTDEARIAAWDKWWPKIEVIQKKMKSLKEELWNAHYMGLDLKYMSQCLHSDVNPYEVIEERTEKLWIVRRMKAVEMEWSKERRIKSFVPGGFLGHFDDSDQEWDISSDPDGEVVAIRKHIDGRWYDPYGIRYVPTTEPYKHYDFNF